VLWAVVSLYRMRRRLYMHCLVHLCSPMPLSLHISFRITSDTVADSKWDLSQLIERCCENCTSSLIVVLLLLLLLPIETPDSGDSAQHSPLKFIVEPTGELFVRENSRVILNCSAAAVDNRPVSVTWLKDGSAIPSSGSSYSPAAESHEASRITVDQSGSLVIVGVVRRYGVSDHARLEAGSKTDTSRDSRRRPAANHRGVVGGDNSAVGDQGQYECLASHPTYGTIASTPVHLRIVCK